MLSISNSQKMERLSWKKQAEELVEKLSKEMQAGTN